MRIKGSIIPYAISDGVACGIMGCMGVLMKQENKMELPIYVLHGTWYTQGADGAEVNGVSADIGALLGELDRVADTKAGDYVEMCGNLQEERGDRYYEVVDGGWRYAKFHISEHLLAVPELAAGETGTEDQKRNGM